MRSLLGRLFKESVLQIRDLIGGVKFVVINTSIDSLLTFFHSKYPSHVIDVNNNSSLRVNNE